MVRGLEQLGRRAHVAVREVVDVRPVDFKGCRRCNAIVIGWVCEMCGLPLGAEDTAREPALSVVPDKPSAR